MDLEKAITEYFEFENRYFSSVKDNHLICLERDTLKEELSTLCSEIQTYQLDKETDASVISSQQQALNQRCNCIDKNREQAVEIEQLKEQIQTLKQEAEKTLRKHERVCAESKAQHQRAITEQKQRLQEQELREWSRVTEAQEQTIGQLKRRLATAETDHRTQTALMTKQFEKELAELQQQLEHARETQAAAANQERELYRQKLQEARTEWQQEILDLRSTVTNLRQQLAFYDKPVGGASLTSRQARPGPASKSGLPSKIDPVSKTVRSVSFSNRR